MLSCSAASEASPSPLPAPKMSTWEQEQCLITNTSVLATVELLLCYLFNKSGDWLLCRLIIRTRLCQAAKRNSAFVRDVYFYQYNLLTESHSPLASQVAIKFFILGGGKEAFSNSCLFMDLCNQDNFGMQRKLQTPLLCPSLHNPIQVFNVSFRSYVYLYVTI